MILQDGRKANVGGVISAPDDELFVPNASSPQSYLEPSNIEVRHWEHFALTITFALPQAVEPPWSIASSPDGRWLVAATGNPARLVLLDRQTGEIMSYHNVWGYVTSGLAFDPTSIFVVGVKELSLSAGDFFDVLTHKKEYSFKDRMEAHWLQQKLRLLQLLEEKHLLPVSQDLARWFAVWNSVLAAYEQRKQKL